MGYTRLASPDLKQFNLDMFVSSAINKSSVVAHGHIHLSLPSHKLVAIAQYLVSLLRGITDIPLRLHLQVFNSDMPSLKQTVMLQCYAWLLQLGISAGTELVTEGNSSSPRFALCNSSEMQACPKD